MKGKVWNITETADLKSAVLEILNEHSASGVLALYGDLGAGKTTFTQTLGELLQIDEAITSPTFVLMKRYSTTHPRFRSLVHIDAYRLDTSKELQVLGLADWLKEEGTLLVVEWADKVEDLLPTNATRLKFSLAGNIRTLELA